MSQAIALALVSMLCYGVTDVLFSRLARSGAQPHHVLMTTVLAMVPITLAWSAFTGSLQPSASAAWASVGAIFSFAGFYLFTSSLRTGAVSIAAPVFRLQFVVTGLLAMVFLDESMTVEKIAGVMLAVIAVWLLLGGRNVGTGASLRGMTLLLGATTSIGIALFLFKVALVEGAAPGMVLACQIVTMAIIASIAALWIDRGWRVPSLVLRSAPTLALVQTCGFVALVEALSAGEASVVSPLAQMSFVVSAIIGMTLFREAATWRSAAGLGSAAAAVWMFALAAG